MSSGHPVRVVISAPGTAGLTSTDVPPRQLPTGRVLHMLWGQNASGEPVTGPFPGPGDLRFFRLTLAGGETPANGAEHFHATESFDMGVVLSGRVVLEVDGEPPVLLQQGDSFVQLSSSHRWSNPSTEPCDLVVVMFGTAAVAETGAAP